MVYHTGTDSKCLGFEPANYFAETTEIQLLVPFIREGTSIIWLEGLHRQGQTLHTLIVKPNCPVAMLKTALNSGRGNILSGLTFYGSDKCTSSPLMSRTSKIP